MDIRVKKAVRLLNECKHKVDLIEAEIQALHHKKAALENLVTLFGWAYFADPRHKSEDGRERIDEARRLRAKDFSKRNGGK